MFYFFVVSLMDFFLSCSFLVPDSCWATVRNSNSMYAYKRGLHIIQNNKNDAFFCSFSTIWQLFWGFFYLFEGGYLSVSTNWLWYWFDFDLLCFTPLSAILQLYHGDPFQWWKTPEYPERTTDHGQASGKLYHLRHFCNLQSRARTNAVLVIGLYELLGKPTT